jgi:hypothetical protein
LSPKFRPSILAGQFITELVSAREPFNSGPSPEHRTAAAVSDRYGFRSAQLNSSIKSDGTRDPESEGEGKKEGEEAMAKGPTANISEQATERTMQAANYGIDWMRQMTEDSINHGRAMFEGFFTTARRAADSFDQQAADMRERSMSIAADTISNAFDFAHKAMHVRAPQELVQLQNEFMSHQAQALAEQGQLLGQGIAQRATEVGKMASPGLAEASRKSAAA